MEFGSLTTVTMSRFITKGRRRALGSLDKHWADRAYLSASSCPYNYTADIIWRHKGLIGAGNLSASCANLPKNYHHQPFNYFIPVRNFYALYSISEKSSIANVFFSPKKNLLSTSYTQVSTCTCMLTCVPNYALYLVMLEIFNLGNLNELASSVPLPCVIASNASLKTLEGPN